MDRDDDTTSSMLWESKLEKIREKKNLKLFSRIWFVFLNLQRSMQQQNALVRLIRMGKVYDDHKSESMSRNRGRKMLFFVFAVVQSFTISAAVVLVVVSVQHEPSQYQTNVLTGVPVHGEWQMVSAVCVKRLSGFSVFFLPRNINFLVNFFQSILCRVSQGRRSRRVSWQIKEIRRNNCRRRNLWWGEHLRNFNWLRAIDR